MGNARRGKVIFIRSIIDFDHIGDKELSQFIAVSIGMDVDSLFDLLRKEAIVNEEQEKRFHIEMWRRLLSAVQQHYIVIDYVSDLVDRIVDPATMDSKFEEQALTEIKDIESSRYFTIGSIDMERRQIMLGNRDLFALDQENASEYAEFWYILRQQLCSYNDLLIITENEPSVQATLHKFADSRLLYSWDKSILETARMPVTLVPQGYLEVHDEDQIWVLKHAGEQIRINTIEHLYWAYAHPLLRVHQVYERILRDTGYDAVELASHMLENVPILINEGERLLYIDEAIRHVRSYSELLDENEQLKLKVEEVRNDTKGPSNSSLEQASDSDEQNTGEN